MQFPRNNVSEFETIELDSDGAITLNGGDFASTEINLTDPLVKANFVAAHIMVYGNEKLLERFEKVVLEHTGAKGIIYNIRFTYSDGKPANTFFSPEYSYPEDYADYGDDGCDDDEEDDVENVTSISFKEVLKNKQKLKVFLFSDRANVSSEISYG